ncbi:MAG: Gfo/Idh/MocA family oxidoreductase [Chlorobi bacterium]|nr:Gfo/Idh/MocA family oxidoreductase [Chlorobiota bacterium]
MTERKIKVGVIGVGKLGGRHLYHLLRIPEAEVIGIYDTSENVKEKYKREGIRVFDSPEELLDNVEAVVIASPTHTHYDYAIKAIKRHIHVFIEKPMAETLEQAQEMAALAEEAGIKTHVGYVERFNPAFISAQQIIETPLYIQTQRLAPFTSRGTDVSVVLDLMTHDIDLILSLTPGSIMNVHATGMSVVTSQPDIVSAYLEFDNGLVSYMSVSRFAIRKKRRFHIYQKNGLINMDLGRRRVKFISPLKQEDYSHFFIDSEILDIGEGKLAYTYTLKINNQDAIRAELRHFLNCIINDEDPLIPLTHGYMVLQIAHQILDSVYRYIRRMGMQNKPLI